MFHFHSIRRKMAAGFLLGLVMLLALSAIGIVGLQQYKAAVTDLQFSLHKVPRKSDLVENLGGLWQHVCMMPAPDTPVAVRTQQHAIRSGVINARTQLDEFRLKLTRLPRNREMVQQERVLDQTLTRIESGLDGLLNHATRLAGVKNVDSARQLEERLRRLAGRPGVMPTSVQTSTGSLTSVLRSLKGTSLSAQLIDQRRDVARRQFEEIRHRLTSVEQASHDSSDVDVPVADSARAGLIAECDALASAIDAFHADQLRRALQFEMQGLVSTIDRAYHGLPDPQDAYRDPMERDHNRRYELLFHTVCGLTLSAIVLFATLSTLSWKWIFQPIQRVHQGVRRVAQGDFDYRLRVDSRDEMAALADSFNKMTDRFQETRRDLDSLVRQQSQQLVRSERLAGVGFLAAGVAHEINNPLQAISLASDALTQRIDELVDVSQPEQISQFREYLAMMQREAARCKGITGRLLDFARGSGAERIESDLRQIIVEVLDMVSHLSRYRDRRIEFEQTETVCAEVNQAEIKQVVLNLVANGLESMDAGGQLIIRMAEQTDYITVAFQDSGCGMTPDTLRDLFEPFFTNRRDGKGTGLGLCISDRIVREHGGTLDARSDGPGCGSTFELRLPRQMTAQRAA